MLLNQLLSASLSGNEVNERSMSPFKSQHSETLSADEILRWEQLIEQAAEHRGVAVARNRAGEAGIRFLLVSGRPLKEPVAWQGPIVMNTQEELAQAYRELREGSFIRTPAGGI